MTHPSRVSLDANENGDPSISPQEEGIRRSICDMSLLLFHLVLSSFTFEGVDVKLAGRVLEWNLRRYPNGEFLWFFLAFLGGCHVFFLLLCLGVVLWSGCGTIFLFLFSGELSNFFHVIFSSAQRPVRRCVGRTWGLGDVCDWAGCMVIVFGGDDLGDLCSKETF